MSDKIQFGKEYLIEANFDNGMSLLQDFELAYDVYELFQGDPFYFVSDMAQWLAESRPHYRVRYTVEALDCNDNIAFTAGVSPQCTVSYPRSEVEEQKVTNNSTSEETQTFFE